QREQLQKDGKSFGSIEFLILNNRLVTTQSRIDSYKSDGTPKLLSMGVRERFRGQDSPLYARGEVDHPGATVPRGMISVVTRTQPKIRSGSGRLELADWIASKDNPLTARVMVNRVWMHLFGRGLVATPNNFGAAGMTPSHPELLDTLSVQFAEQGWSVKK